MNPPATTLSGARRFARIAMALSLFACAAPGFAAPDWDMMGIKLGMTEAQVKAALQAYDPKGKIIASNSSFSYSDKVNQFRTPTFLNSMEVRVTRLSILIPLKVWFSGPSGEARVIAVRRQEFNIPNAPTGAQFMQSLTAKYGQPTDTNSANVPVWQEPGKPSCIKVSYGLDFNSFSAVVIPPGKNDFGEAAADIENRPTTKAKGLMPADLTRCGAFMYYTGTNNNPANHFIAGMFDVGAIIATHRARHAWVRQLEADAVRKREGQGQAPRL